MSAIDPCCKGEPGVRMPGSLAGIPHTHCASTITNLLAEGIRLEEVQHLAGHADPRTTRPYGRSQNRASGPSSRGFRIETPTPEVTADDGASDPIPLDEVGRIPLSLESPDRPLGARRWIP